MGFRDPVGPRLLSAGKDSRGCPGKDLAHPAVRGGPPADLGSGLAKTMYQVRISPLWGQPFSIFWSPTRLDAA